MIRLFTAPVAALFSVFALLLVGTPSSVQAAPKKYSLPLRINCGGGTVKDQATGEVWLADKNYVVRGKKYRFNQDLNLKGVPGAAPEAVYRSVRRAAVSYRFKGLPDGLYQVRLHFMDGKKQALRSMDFWVGGVHLIQNLSIREAAGGADRGYVHEAIVEVKGGHGLDLRGTRGHGDDVFISAIEILPAPKGSVPTKPVSAAPSAPFDLAQQLHDFADGPVRVVWTRTDEEEDFYMKGADGTLYGFDSEDGKGERVILGELHSYASPMITPDGQKIIFTDQVRHKCFEVGFDGQGLRELVDGYASDVWTDPRTGKTWLYVRTGWRDTKAPIRRYQLNDLNVSEEVWTQSGTGQPQTAWFHLSGDGALAADAFPWPQCGLADLATGGFKVMGKGCWPGVAPDSSHRSFIFIGQHTGVQFFDEPEAPGRMVNLATVPGWTGRKVYHPRWTNDVRYLTLTAPQWMPETELYIGRFDSSFGQIESWFRLTYNHSADYFGDAWFAAASKHNRPADGQTKAPATIARSKDSSLPDLVFVWENERSRNVITDGEGKVIRTWTSRYDGQTRPDRSNGARIKNGTLHPDDDAASVLGAAIGKTGMFSAMLDLTPSPATQQKDGIVGYLGGAENQEYLLLDQRENELGASMRNRAGHLIRLPLGKVTPEVPTQVLVTYHEGQLTGYRDGQAVGSVKLETDLGSWKPVNLLYGNEASGHRPWEGSLENIRVFNRVLNPGEIATLHQQSVTAWSQRQPVPHIVVEAELLQASEPDEPATIAPYVRSLGENVYRIKKVISGELADPEIVVLQWVVLGGQMLPSASREEGHVYRLDLEPAESHPQLSGEHRSTDIFEPMMNVYYDVGL